MPDNILTLLSDPTPVLTVGQIIWGLVLAFILSYVFSHYYNKMNAGLSSSLNFPHALIMVSLTACFIMSVVGNSLARAFSLAGALSIVRFRNAIKETEEIAAIFLAMSIGIGCGSGFYVLSSLCTFIILGFWLLLKSNRLGLKPPLYVLVELEHGQDVDLIKEMERKGINSVLRATLLESSQGEGQKEPFRVYRLQLENRGLQGLDKITTALSQIEQLGFKRLIPEMSPPQS
ncbi:hypothetical protein BVX98_02030 [bacterium F11]|nr:hypothetical protein BVX98_02030 [bacterium F11]